MINEKYARMFCCEDISLIENYQEAINDTEQTWDCHHRLETEMNISRKDLIKKKLYYERPSSELIFLTHSEHISMHHKGKHISQETLEKMKRPKSEEHKKHISEAHIGLPSPTKGKHYPKLKWIDSFGNIVEMDKINASRWHPDWIPVN